MLWSERAEFPLARELRSPAGARLGDVFAFVSGLYFRGKLAYASRFAPDSSFVITAGAGLLVPEARLGIEDLRAQGRIPITASEPAFRRPFERSLRHLRRDRGAETEAVLLGSIASDKYVATLLEVFGERLLFPPDFVGRGDMSRGGLLLRAARDGVELRYAPVAGAVRHGPRPPKLDPRTRVRR